jgi:hypothetical protein
MANNTIVNLRRSNYEKYDNRKRVFVPTNGVIPRMFNTGNQTTTTWLNAVGPKNTSAAPKVRRLKNSNLFCPLINTADQTVAVQWRVPDDFYGGEKTHVYLVVAKYNTTTSTNTMTYAVKYNPIRVIDYGASGTPEALKAASSTAMDTALSETLSAGRRTENRYGMYRWSPTRGMRGTINAGKIQAQDIVDFNIAVSAASNGMSLMILGIEVDYERRLRGNVIEKYSD